MTLTRNPPPPRDINEDRKSRLHRANITTVQQSGCKKTDLIQALAALFMFDVVLQLGGFRWLHRLVKKRNTRTVKPDVARSASICDAIQRACMIYPKQALCLQRSAVTTYLLRRAGIEARMVIGCRPLPFAGHAWVEVNGKVVNDNSLVKDLYQVLEVC